MKNFDRIFALILGLIATIIIAANIFICNYDAGEKGRPYLVEIERIAGEIEKNGPEAIDLSGCQYVISIEKFGDDFYRSENDYCIREIDGRLYRFDYTRDLSGAKNRLLFAVNILLFLLSAPVICVLLFVRSEILLPFERLKNVPYELARGNLAVPLKESKNHFFGKFVWGIDLLREHMEEQKKRELMLQKEKKTLLLSLSHDIKTPLSAIKLYAKALMKNLYSGKEKQDEIADKINRKADEIEAYISQITAASREDFLSLEIAPSEFYLSDLMKPIMDYYTEKLSLLRTDFSVLKYDDCLLCGDLDRSVEVLQNIMENAIKYGDGHAVKITFAQEDGCILITVENSGCTLSDGELLHIFDSFWRGANAKNTPGSGLGLYICRQLMHKMNGEIFAGIDRDAMLVTVVFAMAG